MNCWRCSSPDCHVVILVVELTAGWTGPIRSATSFYAARNRHWVSSVSAFGDVAGTGTQVEVVLEVELEVWARKRCPIRLPSWVCYAVRCQLLAIILTAQKKKEEANRDWSKKKACLCHVTTNWPQNLLACSILSWRNLTPRWFRVQIICLLSARQLPIASWHYYCWPVVSLA